MGTMPETSVPSQQPQNAGGAAPIPPPGHFDRPLPAGVPLPPANPPPAADPDHSAPPPPQYADVSAPPPGYRAPPTSGPPGGPNTGRPGPSGRGSPFDTIAPFGPTADKEFQVTETEGQPDWSDVRYDASEKSVATVDLKSGKASVSFANATEALERGLEPYIACRTTYTKSSINSPAPPIPDQPEPQYSDSITLIERGPAQTRFTHWGVRTPQGRERKPPLKPEYAASAGPTASSMRPDHSVATGANSDAVSGDSSMGSGATLESGGAKASLSSKQTEDKLTALAIMSW